MAAKKSERKRKGPPGGTRPIRISWGYKLWRDQKRKDRQETFTSRLLRRMSVEASASVAAES